MSRRTIIGVDFSGAVDAGKRIWICRGETAEERLQIKECLPARDLPNSGRGRRSALPALREFVNYHKGAAIGLDFPFGLPRRVSMKLFGNQTWEKFAVSFAKRFDNEKSFRDACRNAAGCREPKRVTDISNAAPWCPFNLKLYRQTYFGIAHVLVPLLVERSICVIPMQKPLEDKPWILEICPASTLRALGLYKQSYKGKGLGRRRVRERILRRLKRICPLSFSGDDLQETFIANTDGDALDSLVACFTTFRTIRNLEASAVEGMIYS